MPPLAFGELVAVDTSGTVTVICTVDGPGVCKSCGADVIWVKTPKGNSMPIDPPEDDQGSKAVSHFATCPDAKTWRTR